MRKLTRTAVVAAAALTALALAAAATAAYTSPKLTVSYATGNITRVVASAAVTDDATARAAIVIPNGTTITASAAGSTVGTVRAQVSALALGGALLPLTGNIIVAPPGAVPAASQAACIGTVVPQVTLLLVLQAAGQTINLPAYITPTPPGLATLGATQLVFCLAPPDIPPPAGATFGAKFLSADMTLNGVFSPVAQGAWVGTWLPWNAGVGTINGAAQVLSPASIAPGGITLTGRKVRSVKRLAGRVTQGGTGVATRVAILAGTRRIGSAAATANGNFTFAVPRASKATSFRARAIVVGRDAPTTCAQYAPLGIPCVNPTISGFTATSGTVRIR